MDAFNLINSDFIRAFSNYIVSNKKDYEQECPFIEFEQDMDHAIPFCRLDGQMCNAQCKNNK